MSSGYSDMSEIRKSQFYAMHQKPAKIDLLDERPRRESLVEQQLSGRIERSSFVDSPALQQQVGLARPSGYGYQAPLGDARGLKPRGHDSAALHSYPGTSSSITTSRTTASGSRSQPKDPTVAYSELVSDLARKEAKLRRELAYTNQHLANPWARPPQVREPRREPEPRAPRSQQRWSKEIPVSVGSPSSRPTSRASSTRSTTESDLMEKAEQLMKDVEELEKKPLKTQQILIESGASKQQQQQSGASGTTNGSIHTAVIKVPITEPDNKSPLPFAFDNFSTLGVRGNIASVGAAEPDTPYPPIYPMVKRSPSPRIR